MVSGVHSDVGGSYPEPIAGLSKIALEWMLLEAGAAGLLIDARRASVVLGYTTPVPERFMPPYVPPDNSLLPQNSLHGFWWWALECVPRKAWSAHGPSWRVPLGRWRRQIPKGAWIHESVLTGQNRHPLPGLPCRAAAAAGA